MPIQIHPEQLTEWRLAAKAEDPDAPTFLVAPLSGFEKAALWARHQAVADGDTSAAANCYRETIRTALRGWRNVFGEDGAPAEFKADAKGRPTPETLEVIARDWLTVFALADHILSTAILTRADLGNSKPVS